MRAACLLLVVALVAGCLGGDGGTPDEDASPAHLGVRAVNVLDDDAAFAGEPHVAIHAENVIVAEITFRTGNTTGPVGVEGHRWLTVHASHDGGASWASRPLPPSVLAPFRDPGARVSLGDPVLAYAPDGTLYLAGLASYVADASVGGFPVTQQSHRLSVFVTRSDDHGASWSPAVFHREGAGTSGFPVFAAGTLQDKPWLTTDATGGVHLAWTEFHNATVTDSRERLWYTRSTDGSGTWQAPALVAEDAPGHELLGAVLAVSDAGVVHVGAAHYPNPTYDQQGNIQLADDGRQLMWLSRDGGATFEGPMAVGDANKFRFAHAFPGPAGRVCVTGVKAAPPGPAYVTCTEGEGWQPPRWFENAGSGAHVAPAGAFVNATHLRVALYDTGDAPVETPLLVELGLQGDAVDVVNLTEAALMPGLYRREYLGHAVAGEASWVAFVAGNGEDHEDTWVEAVRVATAP